MIPTHGFIEWTSRDERSPSTARRRRFHIEYGFFIPPDSTRYVSEPMPWPEFPSYVRQHQGAKPTGSGDRSEARRDRRRPGPGRERQTHGRVGHVAVQKGRLRWTTTLPEGLPTLATRMRREYASATLEQLLAHEARLPTYTQPSAQRVEEMRALAGSRAEQLSRIVGPTKTECDDDFTPGPRFHPQARCRA